LDSTLFPKEWEHLTYSKVKNIRTYQNYTEWNGSSTFILNWLRVIHNPADSAHIAAVDKKV